MQIGSYLLGLFGGSSEGVSLFGPSDRLMLYKSSISQADKEAARLRKDPTVVRDLARLDQAIAKAKTPEDLLKDPEALRVLLQGLGLADQVNNQGLARKALLSNASDAKSLARTLTDTRWRGAAEQLDFAGSGLTKLKSAEIRQVIADGLVEYKRLTAISEKSQAVADALYIRKLPEGKAPDVYGVLGNTVLRRVATTVAGLPPQLAIQSIEAQARSLQARFKLEDFADPAKREKLIQRYLLMATDSTGSGLSLTI